MRVVESDDGGSARVCQDFAPIAVEVLEVAKARMGLLLGHTWSGY